MTDLSAAADVLAGWPRVVVRLLDTHVPGPDGRCLGCTSQVRPAPVWPCTLADLARLATRAADAREAAPTPC